MRVLGPAVAVYLLGVLLEVVALWALNDGVFAYTLDDPYVHLELARHLAQGEHGINAGEFSAPASSLLWPWLLVPGWWLGGAVGWPLGLNLLAGLLATAAFAAAATRVFPSQQGAAVAFALLMVVVGNLVPLTLTGMEHTLQVALAAWLAVALLDVDAGGRARPWAVLVAVLLPLVRFEDTGVVLLAAAWWAVRGQRAAGALVAAAVVATLAGSSAWLHARSGFWLPFSVLSKNAMFDRALLEIYLPAVAVPLLLAGLATWWGARQGRVHAVLPALALAAMVGHTAIAQVGLFHRYLGYVTVLVVIVAAWTFREPLRRQAGTPGQRRPLVLVALILAVVNGKLLVDLPWASAHIWRQQGQLHRLATEVVQGPVAVNDIGWVSLQNEHYVLDLVGLASADALRARLEDGGVVWMDRLARDRGVQAVMIFDHWFPRLPRAWRRVGTLVVDVSAYAEDDRRVGLYALDRAGEERLRAGLEAFAPTLPQGVHLELAADE
ncbi:MAG: hypothetical protein H6732_18845 [Alphaproteobacteria bacterium]|nr:hypothetical protein [Alphaproteobacteria bacterium]